MGLITRLKIEKFKYLESFARENRVIVVYVTNRIRCDWMKLREVIEVLCDKKVQLKVKKKFYKTVVRPAIICCWALNKKKEIKTKILQMRMIRYLSVVTRLDRIRNKYIRESLGITNVVRKKKENRLR